VAVVPYSVLGDSHTKIIARLRSTVMRNNITSGQG